MAEVRTGGILINRIHRISGRVFQQLLEKEGVDVLPPGQGRIVFSLMRGDGIPVRELVARTGLDKSGLSLTLDRMQKAGLIVREVHEEDRRMTLIHLTDKARANIPAFERVSEKMVAQFYKGFNDEEIDGFERNLQRILQNLESFPD